MRYCSTKHRGALDETVCAILTQFNRIAVVGLSNRPWRDSNRVALYLLEHGYDIVPVNPEIGAALGMPAYPELAAVPAPIDIVNIFRREEYIGEIVDEAIRFGARAIWMQRGLVEEKAAERARAAGLLVVMDRCIMVEHSRHIGSAPKSPEPELQRSK